MKNNFDFDINKINNITNSEKAYRQKSLDLFPKNGFPSKKIEEWKFTDLNKILNKNFKKISNKIILNERSNFEKIKNFKHNYILLTNGILTSSDFQYEDTTKISINKFIDDGNKIFEKFDSLSLLNDALSLGGYSLEVSEEYKFKKPLIIYNTFSNNLANSILNNKNKIKLNRGAKLTLIEHTSDKNRNSYVKNTKEIIQLGKDSSLISLLVQKNKSNGFFYKYLDVSLKKDSDYKCFILTSGLKFNKTNINANLEEMTSKCSIYSALMISENEHQEIKTRINHLKPNCESFQKIKNVINKKGKGIYQGKIFVKDVAQKTNAYQLSNALLLAQESEFNAKPELEIYADDVKCSHGSSSGSIDLDALHYLMTRGINFNDAKRLIIKGFLSDIFENVENEEILKYAQGIIGDQINEF